MMNLTLKTRTESMNHLHADVVLSARYGLILGISEHSYKKKRMDVPHIHLRMD